MLGQIAYVIAAYMSFFRSRLQYIKANIQVLHETIKGQLTDGGLSTRIQSAKSTGVFNFNYCFSSRNNDMNQQIYAGFWAFNQHASFQGKELKAEKIKCTAKN